MKIHPGWKCAFAKAFLKRLSPTGVLLRGGVVSVVLEANLEQSCGVGGEFGAVLWCWRRI